MRAQPQGTTRVPVAGRGRDLHSLAVFRTVMWVERASWASNQAAAVRGGEISTNLGS